MYVIAEDREFGVLDDWKAQLLLLGAASIGSSGFPSLIAEVGHDYRDSAWDRDAEWCESWTCVRPGEEPGSAPAWWALPWMAQHLIEGEDPE